jgi:hypothetical protein
VLEEKKGKRRGEERREKTASLGKLCYFPGSIYLTCIGGPILIKETCEIKKKGCAALWCTVGQVCYLF